MINGLEGIPGSGKSYEAVVFHALEALKDGRLVVTNLPLIVPMFAAINPDYRRRIELRIRPAPVRGTWDASRITVDEEGNTTGQAFELFEDGHMDAAPAGTKNFGGVWCFYHTFKDKKGRGPLFVIDECHVSFPKLGTDKSVVEWFKLHRHYNSDVLLMTQSFRQLCPDLTDLIAMLIKVRKADILGKKDAYIRKVHGGYRGGVVSTEERKYKPEFFPLYKSHTQGVSAAEAAASDVKPMLVKFNRLKWAVLAGGAALSVWAWWPADAKVSQAKTGYKKVTVETVKHTIQTEPWYREAEANRNRPLVQCEKVPERWTRDPAECDAPPPAAKVEAAKPSATAILTGAAPGQSEGKAGEIPEPYGAKGLHIAGFLVMGDKSQYSISISQSGQLVSMTTDKHLAKIGYTFKPLAECAAVVEWGGKSRSITCDSPSLTMGSQARL